MNVFDFSVGSGRLDRVFEEDVIHYFPIDANFLHPDTERFMSLKASHLVERYGRPDFIWASPPCVTFSVASQAHHWTGGKLAYEPKTQAAADNQKVVIHLRNLIQDLKPRNGYLIENPRGILRKLPLLADLPRQTVTYCRYGHDCMKPTDLWGEVPGWTPREMCRNGHPDHLRAPKGSSGGTISKHKSKRAEVPLDLIQDIYDAIRSSTAIGLSA